MNWSHLLLLTVVLMLSPVLQAKVEVLEFANPEQEATYNKLIAELRCLVCQNQNLADSNAELAVDMRRKTREMVLEDRSEKEIANFMVERYGDFVLYRPPLNQNTLLLWAGPFLILIVGVTLLLRTIHRRRAEQDVDVDANRLKTAASLLEGGDDKRDA